MNFDLLTINGDIDNRIIKEVLNIPRAEVASRLLIVINTFGGSPFVAYRAMQHLRALYGKRIDVAVPDLAMSAGTLMCMGADRIYMHEGSSLGPLDLQVPHPTDGGQISSLDIRESTYDIFGLTTRVTKQLYIQAVHDFKLGKTTAARVAHNSAVELLKPMVDKIDPFHLHASYRGASIGQKYAYILLASRMLKEDTAQAKTTSKILAEDYEMHGYSITMEEAKSYLMLNVHPITEMDIYPRVSSYLANVPEGVSFVQIPAEVPPKTTREGEDERKTTKKA